MKIYLFGEIFLLAIAHRNRFAYLSLIWWSQLFRDMKMNCLVDASVGVQLSLLFISAMTKC